MNAIILCAGKGVRMRPITEYIPKPLLTIVNRTLLDIHISGLDQHDIKAIGVNLYHKADAIQDYLQGYGAENIVAAVEPELLGTGGALRNFHHFDKDDLLVASCDAIGSWDIGGLTEFHRSNGGCATLVLSRENPDRIFEVNDRHEIVNIGRSGTADRFYDFAGTVMYSPTVFSCLPEERAFSFLDLIRYVKDQGKAIYGYTTEMAWHNINTIEAYYWIHREILNNGTRVKGVEVSGSCYIDPNSVVDTKKLDGFVVIGANCTIGREVTVQNTIVLAGSTIVHGDYSNCIVSDNFCIKVK